MSKDAAAYLTAQCTGEACRFRFPATLAKLEGACCPRCGSELAVLPRQQDTSPLTESESPVPCIAHTGPLVGVLDNIRSIHNVGSMFRTADGARMDHLYLCGMTATPEQSRLAKAALGAETTIPWSYSPNTLDTVSALVDSGYYALAIEKLPLSFRQPSLFETWPLPEGQPVALIVGNEKAGVDPDVLDQCHAVLSLPMGGHKTSLNAAVAFGIAAYHLRYATGDTR